MNNTDRSMNHLHDHFSDIEESNNTERKVFGVQLAGYSIEWHDIIRRPQVMLRIISWIFSIIVFGCIAQNAYVGNKCILNNGSRSCSCAVAIGVFTFLTSTCIFIGDIVFHSISSYNRRRKLVLIDVASSGFWTLAWFINFSQLIYHWHKTNKSNDENIWRSQSAIQAAITFSFLSIFVWAILCKIGLRRLINDQTLYKSAYPQTINPMTTASSHGFFSTNYDDISQPISDTEELDKSNYNEKANKNILHTINLDDNTNLLFSSDINHQQSHH